MPKIRAVIICLILVFAFAPKTFAADVTPPTTTSVKTPATPNGKNLWYVTPITVTLSATDLGSGVKEINYQVSSAPWQKVSFADTLNLAPNPSFETADVNSNIYTQSWVKNSPGNSAHYERDTTTFAPGFDIVSIKISSTAQGGFHEIDHAENFAVATPYSNMNASAWIKTSSADSAYFTIIAVSQDSGGNKTYSQIAQSPVVAGTTDWTQISQNFVVTAGSAIGVYMQVGIQGKGTVWVDAVSISSSTTATSTDVSVGSDGEHILQYYSVDRAGNIESTKSISFKIDQTPPGNWHDSGAIRGLFGSDHELYVYTNVEDPTSGLSVFTDHYQYHTDTQPGFGYYGDFLKCNTTWHPNGWVFLITPPFTPGAHSAYLITLKTDFCNNDWKVCKTVRFYSEDMAGNSATKDYCINGPWIIIRGKGIVRGNAGINMIAEAVDHNTDGLIEVGNNLLSFFSTSTDWKILNYPAPTDYTYDQFWNLPKGKTQMGSTLPISSGVYYVNGNLTINNAKIPTNYSSKIFNAVIFVNGILTIDYDLVINQNSTLLFVVKGDTKVKKTVSSLHAGVFSDGNFYTAYDMAEGDAMPTLVLKGVYAANQFRLQRTLQGTNNKVTPSEDFTYEPKYITKLKSYLGVNAVKWLGNEN